MEHCGPCTAISSVAVVAPPHPALTLRDTNAVSLSGALDAGGNHGGVLTCWQVLLHEGRSETCVRSVTVGSRTQRAKGFPDTPGESLTHFGFCPRPCPTGRVVTPAAEVQGHPLLVMARRGARSAWGTAQRARDHRRHRHRQHLGPHCAHLPGPASGDSEPWGASGLGAQNGAGMARSAGAPARKDGDAGQCARVPRRAW